MDNLDTLYCIQTFLYTHEAAKLRNLNKLASTLPVIVNTCMRENRVPEGKEYFVKRVNGFTGTREFPNAEYIDCGGNFVKVSIPESMTRLKEMVCSETQINYIPDTLVNLERLSLCMIPIRCIPDTLTRLVYLEAFRSSLETIPDTLIHLEYLDCSETKVRFIPQTLVNLKELDCSETKINVIPSTLTKLKELDCSHTDVDAIPDTLVQLETLFCQGTLVDSIPRAVMVRLKRFGTMNDRELEVLKFLEHIYRLT